jgi:CubicO group peptidase (beta-lactamase class C family)
MGIGGTHFWVDPKEDLVAVLMAQIPEALDLPVWRQTRTLVYQALVN